MRSVAACPAYARRDVGRLEALEGAGAEHDALGYVGAWGEAAAGQSKPGTKEPRFSGSTLVHCHW